MGENRKLLKRVILLGVMMVLVFVIEVAFYQGQVDRFPSRGPVQFPQVSDVTTDAEGNVYVLYEGQQRIAKRDHGGNVLYNLSAESRQEQFAFVDQSDFTHDSKREFVQFGDMTTDEQGNLYVVERVMDINGLNIKAERIVRYTPEGEVDEAWGTLLIDRSGATGAALRDPQVKSLGVYQGTLHVTELIGECVTMWRVLEDGKREVVWEQQVPPSAYLAELAVITPQKVIYTTKSGEWGLLGTKQKDCPEPWKTEVPFHLNADASHLYTLAQGGTELQKILIETVETESQPQTVLTGEQVQAFLVAAGLDAPKTNLQALHVAGDGTFYLALGDYVVHGKNAENLVLVADSEQTGGDLLSWVMVAVELLCILWGLKILYRDIMPRSLILKQILITVPVIVVAMLSLIYVVNYTTGETDREVERGLIFLAHGGQNLLSGEDVQSIRSPQDYMKGSYQRLRAKLTFADDFGKFYAKAYQYRDGILHAVLKDDNQIRMFESTPVSRLHPDISICEVRNEENGGWETVSDYRRVIEGGEYLVCHSENSQGSWQFALGPLYNADKSQIIGMYEVGINEYAVSQRETNVMMAMLEMILVTTVLIVTAFVVVTLVVLSSIRKLRGSVEEVASGNWGVKVAVRSQDEVADLGRRFNDMAQYIQNYIAQIRSWSDAYYRFVPESFLKRLGKESIVDVQLGDGVKHDMSVLVTTIRGFHDLSEEMTPEENFAFINDYLGRMSPAVRQNNGIINKFLTDGLLALFPDHPQEAVESAMAIRQAIKHFNQVRKEAGRSPLEVGIGVTKGPVMLGVIGDQKRLESGVISEEVNLAIDLEQVSEMLGTHILLPASIWPQEMAKQYDYRTLGLVHVMNRDEPLELYDVFAGDPEPMRKAKAQTKQVFEQAVRMYQQGRFLDARAGFVEVLRQNQSDEAARLYFYLCDEYAQNGVTDEWNGALIAKLHM